MIRRLALVLFVVVVASCGGSSNGSPAADRCRELDEQFGPADAWADIVELQRVGIEWESLGCDEVLADD